MGRQGPSWVHVNEGNNNEWYRFYLSIYFSLTSILRLMTARAAGKDAAAHIHERGRRTGHQPTRIAGFLEEMQSLGARTFERKKSSHEGFVRIYLPSLHPGGQAACPERRAAS